ncbi:nuclear transport factor 2 family protein [Paracnuella aquatica]|uniref:nuclear transport factor 2 family protein n=1 Tax=Paracnuella aquatica TaxID=2268757 RepID=UPI000DEFC1BC|nr:nuclear transport factor 2 family protein [Paracnuella aquatica]RPD51156.1 nuclear transport factor 2 family protein [Paracnuella aquatica]
MNETITRDVLTHHLTAFGNNDLNEILKDYTEESEVLTPDGPIRGLVAIRQFFADYFVTIPTGSDFNMRRLTVTGNAAYIVWSSDSTVASIPLGTDTFFLEEGKIRLHTVAANIIPRN